MSWVRATIASGLLKGRPIFINLQKVQELYREEAGGYTVVAYGSENISYVNETPGELLSHPGWTPRHTVNDHITPA